MVPPLASDDEAELRRRSEAGGGCKMKVSKVASGFGTIVVQSHMLNTYSAASGS